MQKKSLNIIPFSILNKKSINFFKKFKGVWVHFNSDELTIFFIKKKLWAISLAFLAALGRQELIVFPLI